MQTKIHIASSSFLLPNNKGWNNLAQISSLHFAEYGQWQQTLLNENSDDPLAIVLFLQDWVSSNTSIENISTLFLKLLSKKLTQSKSPVIIMLSSWYKESIIRLFRDGANSQIENQLIIPLKELAQTHTNLYFLDLDRVFADYGFDTVFDKRNWYAARCRLSNKGIRILADSLQILIGRINHAAKKVLILDCDNTLWGGVIGEDGLENLKLGLDGLGQAFSDFQKSAKKLLEEGILLALCSKNNEDEVWNVFNNHQGMILNREDIISHRINWQEKAINIQEIAYDLSLGLDSFVFWDDNPMEQDKVRKQLPMVDTINVPLSVHEWPDLLWSYNGFAKLTHTSEDNKKTEQYKKRSQFVQASQKATDQISYLKSINLQPQILPIDQGNIARAVQLCQKTNQFTLRTQRHDEQIITDMHGVFQPGCFLVSLEDDYGNHGIVGLILSHRINKDYIFLDTLLLSCRVLGRHLEAWMLNQLIKRLNEEKIQYLVAEFISTPRNNPCNTFLQEHGLNKITETDLKNLPDLDSIIKSKDCYMTNIKDIKVPFLEAYEDDKL